MSRLYDKGGSQYGEQRQNCVGVIANKVADRTQSKSVDLKKKCVSTQYRCCVPSKVKIHIHDKKSSACFFLQDTLFVDCRELHLKI